MRHLSRHCAQVECGLYGPSMRPRVPRGETGSLMPPKHILNAPTRLMKDLGYGKGYAYDHDAPEAFSGQNYFPDGMARQKFYRPGRARFRARDPQASRLLGEAARGAPRRMICARRMARLRIMPGLNLSPVAYCRYGSFPRPTGLSESGTMRDYLSPERHRVALLTIDAQRDFCLPNSPAKVGGSMAAVPAMVRLVDGFRPARPAHRACRAPLSLRRLECRTLQSRLDRGRPARRHARHLGRRTRRRAETRPGAAARLRASCSTASSRNSGAANGSCTSRAGAPSTRPSSRSICAAGRHHPGDLAAAIFPTGRRRRSMPPAIATSASCWRPMRFRAPMIRPWLSWHASASI